MVVVVVMVVVMVVVVVVVVVVVACRSGGGLRESSSLLHQRRQYDSGPASLLVAQSGNHSTGLDVNQSSNNRLFMRRPAKSHRC